MQRTHAVRIAAGIAAAVAVASGGAPAAAQSHYLYARAGSQFFTDSTQALDDELVEATCLQGVPGTDPDSVYHHALANGATGEMALASSLFWSVNPFPVDLSNFSRSAARMAESFTLERTEPGTPVTVRATLTTSGGAQVDGPLTSSAELGALLDLDGCRIYRSSTIFTAAPAEVALVPDCGASGPQYAAGQSGSTLFVRVDLGPDDVLPTFTVDAQIEGEYGFGVKSGTQATFQNTASLYVEVSGATATFASPDFLTLAPEPEGAACDLAAVAVLAVAARRRGATAR